jgi:SAM-dependent methyltransferase
VTDLEARVLAVHAARPGFTSRGFERSGSYDRLAAAVSGRVLDLACGDGALLARLPHAIGVDLSPHELARAGPRVIRARAQALPFADGAFDAVACHLAFMLFEDIEHVVAELARVVRPGGSFVAIMGGGPIAAPDPDDAFPIFLAMQPAQPSLVGDRRARTEEGWRSLFAGWTVAPWERHELVLDGSFVDVWSFFEASYHEPAMRAALARRLTEPVRCRAVTWLARAIRTGTRTGTGSGVPSSRDHAAPGGK